MSYTIKPPYGGYGHERVEVTVPVVIILSMQYLWTCKIMKILLQKFLLEGKVTQPYSKFLGYTVFILHYVFDAHVERQKVLRTLSICHC